MDRVLKIGVWFALAAVVGLVTSGRGGTSKVAPPAAKAAAAKVAPAGVGPGR